MEKKTGKKGKRFFSGPAGRWILAVTLVFLFAAGYSLTASVPLVNKCSAADELLGFLMPPLPVADGNFNDAFLGDTDGLLASKTMVPDGLISALPCPCVLPLFVPPPQGCDYAALPNAESEQIKDATLFFLREELESAATALEQYIGNWLVDGMMTAMLQRLNQAELNLIDWWNTWWFYNMYPAMQDMVKQFSVSGADQARTLQSSVDVQQGNEAKQQRQTVDRSAVHTFPAAENSCAVATAVGGQVRALTVGTAMRKAYQDEDLSRGLNRQGTPAGSPNGSAYVENARTDMFHNTFCDPDGNGGNNDCPAAATAPAAAAFYNADTQVTRRVYNSYTIDVSNPDPDIGPKNAATAAALLENLMGSTAMDPIPVAGLQNGRGFQRFLDRRSYLARHAAVSSVPHMIMGWRMPGSQLGLWIADMRKAAGVPLTDISPNPSYKEVMHAMAVDRFNTGKYAMGMLTDQAAIEREKLIQETLYLMELRDYYELLERTALTLAVQVSIMADERPLPDIQKLRSK